MIYISGPGHGGPALVANTYLEGTYSEVYPRSRGTKPGCSELFKQFSFPGGIPSHVAPETPGSIHEGGELGYSLSHAVRRRASTTPICIVACVIGDGEAETGPLATAWHSNKFLNPVTDGAVLPILHLNGYKIANPTVLARIPRDELEQLLRGYGWDPHLRRRRRSGADARADGGDARPGRRAHPRDSDGRASARHAASPALADDRAGDAEGMDRPEGRRRPAGRRHVPGAPGAAGRSAHEPGASAACSRTWLRSYRPEELFDARGALRPRARGAGARRATAAWARIRTPTAACCCATCAAGLPDLRRRRVRTPEPSTPKTRACSAASCATSSA